MPTAFTKSIFLEKSDMPQLRNRSRNLGAPVIFVLLLVFSFLAQARDWVLYQNGHRTQNYNEAIALIQPGDRIQLDGKTATIYSILGNGNTTKIYDIGRGLALRLPISLGYFRGTTDYKTFISEFYKGYEFLQKTGIRIVRVSRELSRPPKYLVVEKVETKFSLRDYVSGMVYVSEYERDLANQQLIQFARSTAALRQIGDFHIDQLRWTGREWILMDYTSGNQIAHYFEDPTVFTNMQGLPEFYRIGLINEVLGIRRMMPVQFPHFNGAQCRFLY
jgi:hypothetical protein